MASMLAEKIGKSIAAPAASDVTDDTEEDEGSPGADLIAAIEEGDAAKVDAALAKAIRTLG